MLRSFVHQHPEEWEKYLPLVELHYNSTVQSSTGKAPCEIVFGRKLQLPPDLIDASAPVFVRDLAKAWQEAKVSIVKAQ